MIEGVFESSSDCEHTYHWLVNEKVQLAMILVACFLDDELMYERILNILFVVKLCPFADKNDDIKTKEIMLITHYTLALSERVSRINLRSLLHVLTLMQWIALQLYNDEDKQKIKRWMMKEGIDVVILNVHSKPSLQNMCPHIEEEIAWKSTFLLCWMKDELVNPVDILPFVPTTLDLMNKPLVQIAHSLRTQCIGHCLQLVQFLVSKQLPFDRRMTVLNKDFVDRIIHAVDIHPTEESKILDMFTTFVTHAPCRSKISNSTHQKLDNVLEYMVHKMKCCKLPSNDLRVCLTQLLIISSVFVIVSKESMLRLIDDGTLRILLQTFLDSETLKMTDQGKANLKDHHIDAYKSVLYAVQVMTLEGGQEVRCKVVTAIKELYVVPRNLLNPNLALNFPLIPITYGP